MIDDDDDDIVRGYLTNFPAEHLIIEFSLFFLRGFQYTVLIRLLQFIVVYYKSERTVNYK